MVTICDLPPEIILHIFRFYVETEGQKELVENISPVCPAWNKLCRNSTLWIKYDGSLTTKKMMLMCKKGCFSNTKEFIISTTETLKVDDEETLFTSLTNVEVINFSLVEKFSKHTFSFIASTCCKLKQIEIGKHNTEPVALSYTLLEPFFTARGQNLTVVKFSFCFLTSCSLRHISDCCPNLEQFCVMNPGKIRSLGIFPTKHFQMNCPKLKVLNLDNNIRISNEKHPSGFPNLETFTYIDPISSSITDKEFECVLFNSPNLKFLNLSYCGISSDALCKLPACSLEYLYIAKSKIINANNLNVVFEKWCHSLKQVDISYSVHSGVNKAVWKLVTCPTESQLQILNMNFTKIIASVVEKVLQSCTQLEVLNLAGCRNLARGMKKTYSGKSEFKILRRKLREFISTYPNENKLIEFE